MSKLNCFSKIDFGGLKEKFDSLVTEETPIEQQREIGTKLILDYYKKLHTDLSKLKIDSGLTLKEDKYTPIDNLKAVKAVKEKYDKVISSLKNEATTEPKKGDKVFDTKKNVEVTVTKVFTPAKGSALENEPF